MCGYFLISIEKCEVAIEQLSFMQNESAAVKFVREARKLYSEITKQVVCTKFAAHNTFKICQINGFGEKCNRRRQLPLIPIKMREFWQDLQCDAFCKS